MGYVVICRFWEDTFGICEILCFDRSEDSYCGLQNYYTPHSDRLRYQRFEVSYSFHYPEYEASTFLRTFGIPPTRLPDIITSENHSVGPKALYPLTSHFMCSGKYTYCLV